MAAISISDSIPAPLSTTKAPCRPSATRYFRRPPPIGKHCPGWEIHGFRRRAVPDPPPRGWPVRHRLQLRQSFSLAGASGLCRKPGIHRLRPCQARHERQFVPIGVLSGEGLLAKWIMRPHPAALPVICSPSSQAYSQAWWSPNLRNIPPREGGDRSWGVDLPHYTRRLDRNSPHIRRRISLQTA